tara:strand:+ start:198 stop:1928 length:1731 start_codon:yes stop_codon:yes gene_type:complete
LGNCLGDTMALTLNGSTGLSGIVGSAGTPALQGTDTNTGYFFGTDILGFSTGGSERLRVDSNGNLSIHSAAYSGGGTAPQLYVVGTGGRQVKIHNPNAGTCSLQLSNATTGQGEDAGFQLAQLSGGDFYFDHQLQAKDIVFRTKPSGGSVTERLRIKSNGQIGINMAPSADAQFCIKNSDDSNYNVLDCYNDNGNKLGGFSQDSTGNGSMGVRTNAGVLNTFFRSSGISYLNGGNVGIGTTSPATTLHLDSNGTPTTIQIDSDTESSIDFNDHGGSAKRYKIGTNISDNNGQFEFKDITASAERLRVTSDGKLGIGTTTPSSKVQIQTHDHGSGSAARGHHNLLELKHPNTTTTGDGPALLLNGYYSNAEWQYAKISSENSGSGYGAKFKIYVHPADGTQGSNLVQALEIVGDGTGANVTITDGNLKVASGHGIDFSATSDAAGKTTEILDDYEEGTWTPANSNMNSVTTYSADYVKIGKVVQISFAIAFSAAPSDTAQTAWIDGLPFTSRSAATYITLDWIGTSSSLSRNANTEHVIFGGSTRITFYYPTGGHAQTRAHIAGKQVRATFTYLAAA